jgi:hypothetical protein
MVEQFDTGEVSTTSVLTPVVGGTANPWNDTPYFAPGLEADSEHMLAFKVGSKRKGTLVEIRTTKDGDTTYLCMERTSDQAKFRIRAPQELIYLARGLEGKKVVIEYLGKADTDIKGKIRNVHKFNLFRDDSLNS